MSLWAVRNGLRRLCGEFKDTPTNSNGRVLLSLCWSVNCVTSDENEAVNPIFENRNPRNLEQMAVGIKDRGWKTTWPHQKFYHRLMFSRSQHHVTAEVFSRCSPVPVLSCSTKEWAVKKELPSTSCVAACQAVGEVLAHRCHQAGITRMVYREIPWTYRSESFRTAMKEGGIILSEPRQKYR
uniref:Large ribosomal subunit protein uL18m n=1 Tax=Gouania willdenowi TaxID=441366 RepID=A0A8C5D6T2_GOUWI